MNIFQRLFRRTPVAATDPVLRAIQWLRDNPDRHIAGAMAIDDHGKGVSPSSPDASCFCIVGRVACEVAKDRGIDVNHSVLLKNNARTLFRETMGMDEDRFIGINDTNYDERPLVCNDNARPGNQSVLDVLEGARKHQLANQS